MPPGFTIVTTCRGRLEHLRQSLPRFAAQPGARCVVVDYGCPQRCGDWVESAFPQVRVVRSGPTAHFEAARARNLGAAAADTEWLAFLDADALVEPGFAGEVLTPARRGTFYVTEARDGSYVGQAVVARADFERVGGYDAVLQGWGMEDKDLYTRLKLAGLSVGRFAPDLLSFIQHGHEARTAHHAEKDHKLNSTLNLVYCRAKWDLIQLGGAAQLEDEGNRRRMYEQVLRARDQANLTGKPVQVEFPFHSSPTFSGHSLLATLTYRLLPKPRVT